MEKITDIGNCKEMARNVINRDMPHLLKMLNWLNFTSIRLIICWSRFKAIFAPLRGRTVNVGWQSWRNAVNNFLNINFHDRPSWRPYGATLRKQLDLSLMLSDWFQWHDHRLIFTNNFTFLLLIRWSEALEIAFGHTGEMLPGVYEPLMELWQRKFYGLNAKPNQTLRRS